MYNLKLSEDRTESISKYLVKKGINDALIAKKYYGEEKPITGNATEEGKQRNRRVDIVVSYRPLKQVSTEERSVEMIVEDDEVSKVVKPLTKQCQEDTTILLAGGTSLVFNKCEYLENHLCYDINEMINAEQALAAGVSTQDAQGQTLVSCGMIDFKMKPECKSTCFNKPVTILFPLNTNAPCNTQIISPNIFLYEANGAWRQTPKKLELIDIDGKLYYKFELKCPAGKINCDCKSSGNPKRVKIKTKRRYKIVNLTLSNDCPLAIYRFASGKKKNVIKRKPLPSFMGESNVTAILLDKNGDTLIVENQPFSNLHKIRWFFNKRKIDREEEKTGNKFLYRKYKIRPKHLVRKTVIEAQ